MKHPVLAGDQRLETGSVEHVTLDRRCPAISQIRSGRRSSGESVDLVTFLDEPTDEGAPNDTAATGDPDPHVRVGVGSERTVCQKAEM
jgi:hypothetical protein